MVSLIVIKRQVGKKHGEKKMRQILTVMEHGYNLI